MSVLIKNLFGKDMPIPQEGYIDVRLHFKGGKIKCATMQTGERPFYATFDVEKVPTPHGRLKDADAFDERVRVAGGMSEEELTEDFKDGVQTVLYMLSKQSTIIEAEGREE